MNRILILAAVLALTACSTEHDEQPIQTQVVKEAVAQPCTVDVKSQRPALMTYPELKTALAGAANVDSEAQLVMSQLLLHMGWLPVVEAAMQGCEAKATPAAP